MRLDESKRLQAKEDAVIAHGGLTNSKRPSCFVRGVYPTHIKEGHRCYLTDVDGNKYIDFICGLGTNLFGYSHHYITDALHSTLKKGISCFSLSSNIEVQVAERLKEEFPWLHKMRFLKTGSDGCTAAIKIARTFWGSTHEQNGKDLQEMWTNEVYERTTSDIEKSTYQETLARMWRRKSTSTQQGSSRWLILQDGYNGMHAEFTSLTDPAKGVAAQTGILPLMKNWDLIKIAAAVILEPVIVDYSTERFLFLRKLREECTKHGTLLIFDETITAYRYEQGSVTRRSNIIPDLWIGGKAIAGGLPLSVVGGRSDVMEADYFISSTWAGDRLALVGADKAIDLIHGAFSPDELWKKGQLFQERFNAISSDVQAVGYPTRGIFQYSSEEFKALFMQEMCLAGVLIGPSWFYNIFLHDELDNVISITKTIVKKIKAGRVKLKGLPPQSPFAERARNGTGKTTS
jgi:glutamate-1-semialdehyde 2,1-aminomutase